MSNKYTGEVELTIGDKTGRLVYDWRGIAEIHTKYGNEVLSSLFKIDPEAVATLLEIGFKKHNPEITKDFILDVSPPLMSARNALGEAIFFAYYGADGLPEGDKAEGEKAESQKAPKKTK